ncbi:SprT family protein [Jeotgalibacillus aurantiacus]|uniref:SprT family protein n=1 Tax=Jeotgalibacillus aurantiacus TaxID=2763266 RepID=UPI001D0B52DA|nr:SprT family protein [Jeotgalibacillus aurantiacus]
MNNEELQQLTQQISLHDFQRTFKHKAYFNKRLRTTGGRYMLDSHNIEMNHKYLDEHGMDELIGIIKHELAHYHLHIEGRGYQHKDRDFRELIKKVGAPRFCTPLPSELKKRVQSFKVYACSVCKQPYHRKRRINTAKYVCGKCGGKLQYIKTLER